MNDLEQAARQALEALETVIADVKTTPTAYEAQRQAIASLRQALEQPVREPVTTDGWLQADGLLYRLTDDRRQSNRDEISVTMADGSRSIEARTRRAEELLDRMTAPAPQAAIEQEPVAYQWRTRATREGAINLDWSDWENCTKERAQDSWNCPLAHDWLYEARALYTEPPKREWQEIDCPCCGDLARAFPPAPKREWVVLTEEERKEAQSLILLRRPFNEVVIAIENRLQEKNA